MTDATKPLADATDPATDLAVVDSPDVIPEGARIPGYVVQYGVGIPVGVWVGALVGVGFIVAGDVLLPEVMVVPLAFAAFAVAGVAATRAVVGRLRAFQERRLLVASDVDHRPRQLRGAGGSESPVAVRD